MWEKYESQPGNAAAIAASRHVATGGRNQCVDITEL